MRRILSSPSQRPPALTLTWLGVGLYVGCEVGLRRHTWRMEIFPLGVQLGHKAGSSTPELEENLFSGQFTPRSLPFYFFT